MEINSKTGKGHRTESAALLYAQYITTVILIVVVFAKMRKKEKELEKKQGRRKKGEKNISFYMVTSNNFPTVFCAYVVTSVNVHLGQCYDTIIINIFAALYSLQSTSAFIIMLDTYRLSWR